MSSTKRGPILTVFAILFGLLAISNLLKPLKLGGEETGFVFFGTRLSGVPNTILGPVFGIFLAIYAAGVWQMRRYAVPMSQLYAAYVVINLTSFVFKHAALAPSIAFSLAYTAIAIGVSLGSAIILTRRQAELS